MKEREPAELENLPLFGRTAVRLGMINSSQLREALRKYDGLREGGAGKRLGQVLVELGMLSADQVDLVVAFQRKVVLVCSGCGIHAEIPKINIELMPQSLRCGKCGAALREPTGHEAEAGDTADPDASPAEGPEGGRKDLFDDLLGKTIGNCLISEKLGEGGMGVVFKARHQLLNRIVALKVLPKAFKPNQDKVRRFFTEAASLGALRSPHIVQVFNVGEEPGFYFIEMEFVEGGTLDDLIADRAPLPAKDALPVMKEIATGLAVAHGQSIIHRDMKPGNVLLSAEGNFKLADFGLAKNLETSSNVTRDGAMMGTPHFMSPEQCRGDPVDKPSDVYSLGAVFYTLLTGRMPFTSENPMAVVLMHMNQEVRPPSALVRSLPRSYSNLVEKMMAKNPAERYADAGQVLAALESIEKGLEIEYTARRVRRRRLRLAALAASILVLAAASALGLAKYSELAAEREGLLSGLGRETSRDAGFRLFNEALALYDTGDFAASALKAREALKTFSRLPGGMELLSKAETLSRARNYLLSGDPSEALLTLEGQKDLFGSDPLHLRMRANAESLRNCFLALEQGRWEEALRASSTLLEALPGFPAALEKKAFAEKALLAARLDREGRATEALALAAPLAAEAPGNGPARHLREALVKKICSSVSDSLARKDLAGALRTAREASAAFPASEALGASLKGASESSAWFESLAAEGERKMIGGDFEGAARMFAKALSLGASPKIDARLREARYQEALSSGKALLAAGAGAEAEKAFLRAAGFAEDASIPAALARDARRSQALSILNLADQFSRAGRTREASVFLSEAAATFAEAPQLPLYKRAAAEIRRRENVPKGFVYVPGGDFAAGNQPSPEILRVAPFYIARSETTNRQFREFVEAGGYRNDSLWDEEALEARRTFLDRTEKHCAPGTWIGLACPSGQDDLPVASISLFEARAYARFKGGRLPDRSEWMVAAAGLPGSKTLCRFPWGGEWKPDFANLMAGRRNAGPKPAGSFPLDASPFGVMDMAGNVSEWTASARGDRPGYYVIKGGSYRHTRENQVSVLNDESCALASMRWPILGFRLARDAEGDDGGSGGGG